ncbi:MAG: glycosyl hydrolase family 18 protein, partial [Candidatus Limnocylindrales bacterium]
MPASSTRPGSGEAVGGRDGADAAPERAGGPATLTNAFVGQPALRAADRAAFDPLVAAEDDVAAAAANGGLQPSIQYEEAARHAADQIAFAPGSRVTVGFGPRPGDTWLVGGGRPAGLPAGRLDGRTIRRQGDPSGDRPSRTPTTVPRGGGASVDPAPGTTVDEPTSDATPADGATAAFRSDDGTLTGVDVAPAAAISANGLRREIFGFLPYWEVNSSSLRLDYAKLSTIAYFGVGADGAGNLQKRNADGTTTVGWSGWTSSKMTSVITTAHANHTRVVLTVQSFGWNTSGLSRQKQLLGSSTARLTLARQIAAAVRDRGADGVNLDFEPLAATYDAEFTALVRTIRAELNKVHRGYQLTFDTLGSIGNYPIGDATATGAADAVFVMGYDYRSSGSSPVGSIAPLTRTGYDIRETVAAYTARINPSKVILGVPYYGRAWSTSSDAVHATNTSGAKFGASTTVVYDTAADYLAQYGRRYDPAEGVAWTAYQRENCTSTYGCVTSWRQLYVDDAAAIAAKYDLVNAYGLRGAGIWALGYDGTRPDLWAAIQRKFVTDTTPPVAGIRTLPSTVINPGFSVAWAGRDDVGVVSYDVQVSADGGAWSPWLNATKAASAPWFGIDGHGYAFRVRARDPRGNTGPWNVTTTAATPSAALAVGGFGVVRVDGLSIRSAPDTSAAKVGTFNSGTIVAVVGGPRTGDGYTWYQIRGPLLEWGPVSALSGSGWVVAGVTGSTWLSPAKAPNATRIRAA